MGCVDYNDPDDLDCYCCPEAGNQDTKICKCKEDPDNEICDCSTEDKLNPKIPRCFCD